MGFQEIKSPGAGQFLKWDRIGATVEGRYVGMFQGKVLNGRQTQYAKFVLRDGKEVKVNVTTVLERRLREEFTPGDTLRVTYTHDEKGNQPLPAKIFRIEKDMLMETGPTAATAPSSAASGTPVTAPAATSSSVVAASSGPSAAEIAAAMALLQSLNQPAPVAAPAVVAPVVAAAAPQSEYQRLLVILQQSNPKGAAAIQAALESIETDETARTTRLAATLKQQGVAF